MGGKEKVGKWDEALSEVSLWTGRMLASWNTRFDP